MTTADITEYRQDELYPLSAEEFNEIKDRIQKSLHKKRGYPEANFAKLERANTEQRKQISDILLDFFNSDWKMPAEDSDEGRKLRFNIRLVSSRNANLWTSFPITAANINLLKQKLTSGSFYDFSAQLADWQSDQAEGALPDWSIIREFKIQPFDAEVRQHEKRTKKGAFFEYLVDSEIKSKVILDSLAKCQIFPSVQENSAAFNQSCLIYALRQPESGIPPEVVDKLTIRRLETQDANIKMTDAIKLGQEQGINLLVRDFDARRSGPLQGHPKMYPEKKLPNPTYQVIVNKFKDHYFLSFECPFSNDFMQKAGVLAEDIPDDCAEKRFRNGKWIAEKRSHKKSEELVLALFEAGRFKPMNWTDRGWIKTVDRPDISAINDLSYDESYCVRSYAELQQAKEQEERRRRAQNAGVARKLGGSARDEEAKQKKEPTVSRWFADVESDVTGTNHVAFLLCMREEDGVEGNTFVGANCVEHGLNFLSHYNNVELYFHNNGYDSRFFAKYGATGTAVIKGHQTFSMTINHGGKKMKLRDTYSIIPTALANFPKMFGFPELPKEVFPYTYYTVERVEGRWGDIEEAKKHLRTAADRQQFDQNLKELGYYKPDDKTKFDMVRYSMFYCMRDVEVLRKGFTKFRELVKEAFPEIDVYDYYSAPSLANAVFISRVYSQSSGIKYLSGLPAEFIRQSIHGGRVLTALNKRWHTVARLVDFDACSLYPSAMKRIEIPLGPPKVIPPEGLNLEWLNNCAFCYVIRVRFYPTEHHRDFPLFVTKEADGNNLNTDTFTEPITVTLINIEFEDILKYYENVFVSDDGKVKLEKKYELKYEILCGYYFDEGDDNKINYLIQEIYNARLKYKEQKNPLQEVFKLIMNSAYGKTIQKFIDKQIKFIPEADINEFWRKNHDFIVEDTQVEGSSIHKVQVRDSINNQFAPVIIGSLILAMSKRIMNEVMCLAEDIGCKIFYQDTDSMHIRESDIPILAAAYKQVYNRELIGKQLNQFHSDFGDAEKAWGLKSGAVAVESYFLAKKVYIDKLKDSDGKVGYHYRMKGVSQVAVAERAEDYGGLLELYRWMYEGEGVKFNLLAGGKASFEYNPDWTISSRSEFERIVQAKLPKEEYLEE